MEKTDISTATATLPNTVVTANNELEGRDAPKEPVDTRSKTAQRTELIQFLTVLFSMFVVGWSDGTTGPLLPRIQEEYHLKYAVVSLIFVFNCLGGLTGAFVNVYLVQFLGLGKCLVIGAGLQAAGYAIMAPAPPFSVLVLGYYINGIGISIQDAQENGYVAALKHRASFKMGVLHAIYGFGALVAPLSATQFANAKHWSFHYIISCGLAVLALVLLVVIFRGRTLPQCLEQIELAPDEEETAKLHENHKSGGNVFGKLMRLRAVHMLSFFVFIYVGVEVTLGGWMVTYVITERNGGPSSGYVSTGFFGGLAVGRILLLPINHWVGERRVVFLYSLIAVGLEIVVWRVPHLVGDAVAISLIGMFLGPLFPIGINQAGRAIPAPLLSQAIGWIAAFATVGGALIPFITGALAGAAGVTAMQPFLLAMLAAMVVLWALVPNRQPKMPVSDTVESSGEGVGPRKESESDEKVQENSTGTV